MPTKDSTMGMPSNFKTIKCKYYDLGQCKYGDKCNFAHGVTEVRMTVISFSQRNRSHLSIKVNSLKM